MAGTRLPHLLHRRGGPDWPARDGVRVMSWRTCLLLGVVFCLPGLARADKPAWKAGVAVRKITPAEPMWLAGYADRNKPAEGKEHDLYVKALALQDPAGHKTVLLTSDLI